MVLAFVHALHLSNCQPDYWCLAASSQKICHPTHHLNPAFREGLLAPWLINRRPESVLTDSGSGDVTALETDSANQRNKRAWEISKGRWRLQDSDPEEERSGIHSNEDVVV